MPAPNVPPPLRRAATLAVALAGVHVVGLHLLVLTWFGVDALQLVGRWDALFLVLLGLVVAPLHLLQEWAAPRPARTRLLAGLACGPLAALGLLMAHAQLDYLFATARGAAFQTAIDAQGAGLLRVGHLWSEGRTVLVASGAPFAATALTRLFGVRLAGQVTLSLAASLLAFALALRGFVGLPQVSWLLSTPWLSPVVQSHLFLQPFVLPIVLPLATHLLGRGAEDDRDAESGAAAVELPPGVPALRD